MDGKIVTPLKPNIDSGYEFRFDMFQQFCQSLVSQLSVMQNGASCLYCDIMGNKKTADHSSVDCPWTKKTCNKCYTPGHNRSNCAFKACVVPKGFCVMCLLPVHAVYGMHSGRYGMECSSELRDCIKPLITLLYYRADSNMTLHKTAQILWHPQHPKPSSFQEYWQWLWQEGGDHVYGILKFIHALIQSV